MVEGVVRQRTPRIRLLHIYTTPLYFRVMRGLAKSASDAFFEVVEGQQGYFTVKQAADAGYQLGSQAHHVKSGN